MSGTIHGRISWQAARDTEGYRQYEIVHHVRTTSTTDGPQVVSNTPGLPLPGSYWVYGNDVDTAVWCRFEMQIEPFYQDEPCIDWKVSQIFSNKPFDSSASNEDQRARCSLYEPTSPLSEPPKISGGSVKGKKEATEDRYDTFIKTSSHEIIRGDQVEFDELTSSVSISFNTVDLQRDKIEGMLNKVNSHTIWGHAKRTVKLSEWKYEKLWYGSCFRYFRVSLEFDINPDTFDRNLLDEGTKVLSGEWHPTTGRWTLININGLPPDPTNPAHFIRYKDPQGENGRAVLDGQGKPYETTNETISVCSECVPVAPKKRKVLGFRTETTNQPVTLTLTHDALCFWKTSAAGTGLPIGDVGLNYVEANTRWELRLKQPSGLDFQAFYKTERAEWVCNGNNTMFQDIDNYNDAFPDSIRVTPEDENTPGSIRVEKYKEANFLNIVGIPVDLDSNF